MKIRKATKKDIDEIDRIYVSAETDGMKLQFPKEWKSMLKNFKKNEKLRKKDFRKDIISKNNYWVVVEEEGKIAGFGNAEIKKNYNEKNGMITMIYVDDKFRRRGIGTIIVKELIKWLKNKKVKNIESAAYINNKPSIKMQTKLGFKPILIKMRLK